MSDYGEILIIAITLIILVGMWSFTVIVLRITKNREKDQ
jgi:hypothetical protein